MKTRFLLYIPTIIAFLTALCSCSSSGRSSDTSGLVDPQALRQLDAAIENADKFRDAKASLLDSLKNLRMQASDEGRRWRLTIDLAGQYRQFNADSAIHYGNLAVAMTPPDADPAVGVKARISLANALSTAGLFIPAIECLDSVGSLGLSMDSRMDYWKSSRMLYSYMLAYVQEHGTYADTYRAKYIACDDSLLNHLPKSDSFYKFIYCERLVQEGRWNDAKSNLEQLMASLPHESNIFGMSAFQLAEVHKHHGDFRGYAKNLALAAESDIRSCVREGLALPTLANWLYEHGEIDDAFNYINFALEDANLGNIRMRTTTIATLMPLIDKAYRTKLYGSRNRMLVFTVLSSLACVVSVLLLLFVIRNYRRMRLNERKLSASSKKLESYIGNFIGLSSNYAARLDQLSKLVVRKISSGQSDELVKMINSGKFNESDNEEFYKIIDKAILDIFPQFVGNINTLLQPDCRIEGVTDQPLTPELRIYAFVRLGVTQSNRIAQILGYSVNTVYTYRNRMRNRAIDHDSFDSQVENLGHEMRF